MAYRSYFFSDKWVMLALTENSEASFLLLAKNIERITTAAMTKRLRLVPKEAYRLQNDYDKRPSLCTIETCRKSVEMAFLYFSMFFFIIFHVG